MRSDEEFYQKALDEIVHKRVVPSAFAKAFASADGDENRTRANYIRIRVLQLIQEAEFALKKQQEEAETVRQVELQQKKLADELHTKLIAQLKSVESHLRSRFGSSIHIVDESRSLNTNVPVNSLIAKLDKYSSSAIYYDEKEDDFLPLDKLASVVIQEIDANLGPHLPLELAMKFVRERYEATD